MKRMSTEKWGKATAGERYGKPSESMGKAVGPQAPQSAEDKHGAKYDNDAKGWVRGMGPKSPYPTFDGKR